MPTADERFYADMRRKAQTKRRDQSARQATVDACYAERRDAVLEREVAEMLEGEREHGTDGQTTGVRQ